MSLRAALGLPDSVWVIPSPAAVCPDDPVPGRLWLIGGRCCKSSRKFYLCNAYIPNWFGQHAVGERSDGMTMGSSPR